MGERYIPHGFWQKIQVFFFPVFENKKQFLYHGIHLFIDGLSSVLFIAFSQRIIFTLEKGDKDFFLHTLFLFLWIFILYLLCYIATRKLGWPYTYHLSSSSIQKKYIPDLLRFENVYFEKIGTGRSISILSKGIKTWAMLLDESLLRSIRVFTSIIITSYFLLQIHGGLILVFGILLFLGISLGLFLNSKIVQERYKRVEFEVLGGKQLVKILMTKMEILQSGKIKQEINTMRSFENAQIQCNLHMSSYVILFFALSCMVIFSLAYISVYFFGQKYFLAEIPLSTFIGIITSILLMQKTFDTLLDFIKNFGKQFSDVQLFWDFFEKAPEITGYETGNTFFYKSGNIELQNLSYGYEGNKNVFENFNLKIPGGKVTAFVGPSGGGKSTLVKLIAGYLKANSGEILIDRQKLSETSLKSYYQDVGYLTQEPSVFDGTVRENLMYAIGETIPAHETPLGVSTHITPLPNPLLPGEETNFKQDSHCSLISPAGENGERCCLEKEVNYNLENILKLSRCEFIYDLPNGLETEIGERGLKLSGGQKQRLAIAKIFLKNPKIIILDEPTSALDSQSEKAITQAMHELFKDRTVLVIAHRLQTVKYADEIIVIDQGNIIERGNHETLVAKKGYYAEMLELQSGF